MNLRTHIFLVVLFLLVGTGQAARAQMASDTGRVFPYRIETIETPEGLVVQTGGLDVMPDGRLVAVFRRGEVMTYDPQTREWSLFAKGLHDPLGVVAITGREIIVAQRPELTRIRDTDGDGLADVYATITDEFGLSGNYAEFTHGPVMDAEGDLYFSLNTASNNGPVRDIIRGAYSPRGRLGRMFSAVPYRGWVMKYDTARNSLIPWASGFRSPNGLVVDRQGRLFVTDNQGDWLGTSKLFHVRRGEFYGHPPSLAWEPGFNKNPLTLPIAVLEKMREQAVVLFPHGILANSPTQPVIDYSGGRFGPFEGQMFIGEMNHHLIMRVVLEEVRGTLQGAALPFIDTEKLRIGNNRLVFGPDGSLWVGQIDHGWPGDRGIQRIVWTGEKPFGIHSMHLTPGGFELTFTKPIDAATARDPSAYQFTHYYYAYHQAYGSDRYDVAPVEVTAVDISPDRTRVSLNLEALKAGYVYQLDLRGLTAEDGTPLVHATAYYTVNQLQMPGPAPRDAEATAVSQRSR